MAKKMKRFLTLIVALALCIGQSTIPAMAQETTQNVTVNVDVSQAPEESDTVTVTTGESVSTTTHDTEAGVIEESTSTTTEWSGTDENGASVTGTETITTVTGTDDYNGSTLYEGGSVEGSETTTSTETSTETTTENTVLSDETNTTHAEEDGDPYTESTTSSTTETEEGQWIEGQLVEGTPEVDQEMSGEESTSISIDLGLEAPENVTIDLTPNDPEGTTIIKIIPIEDVISGLITLPEDGNYTEIKDDAGNVIGYEVITKIGNFETEITANTSTQTTSHTIAAEVALPEDVKAGSVNIYAEDGETVIGEVVTEVVPEYDENGRVIKYTIIKTTTIDVDETHIEDSQDPSTEDKESQTAIRLPEKPVGSVYTDSATGITTTVTVEEIIDADGAVIGYAIITEQTDAAGVKLGSTTEKKYGTVVTTNTTTITDPTTIETTTKAQKVITEVTEITAEAVVTETEIITTQLNEFINTEMIRKDYAYIEIDGKLYFIYTGSMTVSEGEGHGDTSLMDPITPQSSLMEANSLLDLDKGGGNAVNNTSAPEEGFKYIGYGIDTSLDVSKGNSYSDVVQFRLKSSDGKEYYAMCIDLSTYIQAGHLYNIADITSEDYYQQSGSVDVNTAEKIRSVALNGYWGTASDVGSMDDVKAFLKEYLENQNLSETQINNVLDSLTPGQASAATQAALWKFGNKNASNAVNENNLIYNGNSTDETNAKYLYDALLAAANDVNAELEDNEGVEFLDGEDITAGSITVKSKVVSEDANHANNDDNPDNDIYNTDIGFTLGIEPSKLNGDLIVTVSVGGKEVKKVRLAGADDPLLPMGRIIKNDDGSYTIPDVEIAEGVSITLNLSGTQDLGTGVYIYTSLEGNFNSSQTLVTLATGSRKVNLDMNMDFNVEEPTATGIKVEGFEAKTTKTVDTRIDTKTDREIKTDTETTTTHEMDYVSDDTIRTIKNAVVTIEKVTIEETKEERSWFNSWLKFFAPEGVPQNDEIDIPDDDEDGNEHDGEDDGKDGDEHDDDKEYVDIPDEEVPLADAPKTGDLSLLWVAISGLSAYGMIMLKKHNDEE